MKRIFPTGPYVTGEDLVDRKQELHTISSLLEQGQSVIVTAPRRTGKTSVIKEVLHRLKKQGYYIVDLDLWDVTSKLEFAEKIVEATLSNRRAKLAHVVKAVKSSIVEALRKVEFKATINEYEFILAFGEPHKDPDRLLDEALDFPETFAEKDKRSIVVSFDEFQDVLKLDGLAWLKKMRAKFQRHKKATYVFTGSQTSLMTELFTDRRQAFYRFGKVILLGPLPKDDVISYIKGRFAELKVDLAKGAAERIFELTGGHPYYSQLLCQNLYNAVKGEKGMRIDEGLINKIYPQTILSEKGYFDEMWSRLAVKKNHQLVMKQVIYNDGNPYTAELSRQLCYKIANRLVEMGYLEKVGKAHYQVTDFLFRDYLLMRDREIYE